MRSERIGVYGQRWFKLELLMAGPVLDSEPVGMRPVVPEDRPISLSTIAEFFKEESPAPVPVVAELLNVELPSWPPSDWLGLEPPIWLPVRAASLKLESPMVVPEDALLGGPEDWNSLVRASRSSWIARRSRPADS